MATESRLGGAQKLKSVFFLVIITPTIGRKFSDLMAEKTVLMPVRPSKTKKVAAKPLHSSSLYEDRSFGAYSKKTKRYVSRHSAHRFFL